MVTPLGVQWLRAKLHAETIAAAKAATEPDNAVTLAAADNAGAVLAEPVRDVQDAVEQYRRSVRAPWVPLDIAAVSNASTVAAEPAFDPDPSCPACSVRYSRCYCPPAVTP